MIQNSGTTPSILLSKGRSNETAPLQRDAFTIAESRFSSPAFNSIKIWMAMEGGASGNLEPGPGKIGNRSQAWHAASKTFCNWRHDYRQLMKRDWSTFHILFESKAISSMSA